jgi:ribonuclease R
MKIDPDKIIQILARSSRPRSGREVVAALGVTARQKKEVYQLLHDLVRSGEVRSMRGGKFVLSRQKKTVQGEIRLLRNGSGIVSPGKGGGDIRVPEPALFGAMQGDIVEISVAGSRGHRPEGRVLRIIKRKLTELIGLYQQNNNAGFVVPLEIGAPAAIRITGKHPDGLQHDQIVVVQLTDSLKKEHGLFGIVTEIIGAANEPGVDMLVIARRFGISTTFPEPVAKLAQQVKKNVTPEECIGRRDLRSLPFVTIDGETAKDFDDAVTLSLEPSGGYRLLVAIADVAHYVPQDGPLDTEALQRGTSVYLPGVCVPMLPESLSNGICSLNPHVDRLVMIVELLFDQNASVLETTFSEAVICSHARLTYTDVQKFFDRAPDVQKNEPYLQQLLPMQDLARKLTRRRLQRGALDLDIPEAQILLDAENLPESIVRLQRTMAHRLIEEFMLSANEAVAYSLATDGFPVLYRVHEPPAEHDLDSFFATARRLGGGVIEPKETLLTRLQKILKSLSGHSEQGVLNRLLLRSLKQATYHPENKGHFGLAADYYCHFTSPIRRYPDLMVHRVLKQKLAGAVGETLMSQTKKQFLTIAEQNSHAERRAIDAERDATAMKTCQYMVKHVGEVHDGHVTSVHPFGFFVELDSLFVEGLVHVASLTDTYYRFDDETNRLLGEGTQTVYSVGASVRVKVRDVNVQRREIDFAVEQKASVQKRPVLKKTRKRKR